MNKSQKPLKKMSTEVIIEKTIFASVMNNGFWNRWIAHGIDEDFIKESKPKMISLDGWTGTLANKAQEYSNRAKSLVESNDFLQAEQNYRKAGLYYNLASWVYPEPNGARAKWYKQCLEQFDLADHVSEDKITRHTLTFNDKQYGGRVRIPNGSIAGVVILVIPGDSTKEEFCTYEQDFAREGFIVINFDGTGQGETFLLHGHKADFESWDQFTKGLIEFTATNFPNLSINLFGTSSGGAWAMEASKHPLVSKIVTVSPPTKYVSTIKLPDYFRVRMGNVLVDSDIGHMPSFDNVSEIDNILVFHGGKDLLIDGDELMEVYNRFGQEKRFITYEDEGHCCDFKLGEIRSRSAEWFRGVNINEI
ncbi:alpha/beta hydrolase [Neobacillus sp. 114]|uniref:alpha/beta hydrolase n=1 Tax=Neobacillus sp. 114 TaxID=3048535 RepID=UPI0024C26F08|nr:alpha/beta hydrolase [Neobacillus sp. 114]